MRDVRVLIATPCRRKKDTGVSWDTQGTHGTHRYATEITGVKTTLAAFDWAQRSWLTEVEVCQLVCRTVVVLF